MSNPDTASCGGAILIAVLSKKCVSPFRIGCFLCIVKNGYNKSEVGIETEKKKSMFQTAETSCSQLSISTKQKNGKLYPATQIYFAYSLIQY